MNARDHKEFYEEEAARRSRGPHDPGSPRGRLRGDFAALMDSEERGSVVDFGCGPGLDAEEFVARGIRYVGIDLAIGNARLAAESDLAVLPGSMMAPPLRGRSFDAGWSMSALMHLDNDDAIRAVSEMIAVLIVGSPLTIGTWGSTRERHELQDDHRYGLPRHYYLRSLERNVDLVQGVELVGQVEIADCLDVGPPGWEYHVLRVRAA